MSTAEETPKPEKREREEEVGAETAAAPDAETDTPAAKRAKPDGEATDAPADADAEAPPAAAAAAATDGDEPKGDGEAVAAAAPAVDATVEDVPQADAEASPKPETSTPMAADTESATSQEPISQEKADAEALSMLEFYFGDSNFSWDRFMQSKAGKMGEGLMDISVLLMFNKLKAIVKNAGLDNEAAVAMVARLAESSSSLRVSEDKKQIGRAEPLTEEAAADRMARTVQTKGYKKDSSLNIEEVEKLFESTGRAVYVKICRAASRKLTSVFVEFDSKEAAEKAVEKSEQYTHDGETISVRKTEGPKSNDHKGGSTNGDHKGAESETKAAEPVAAWEPGKILHIAGIPEAGVSRESLKEALKPFGTVLYVDFSFGEREAWIRMENASEVTAAFEATKEKGIDLAAELKDKGTVAILKGDVEKAYYERMEKVRAERTGRSNSNRRGRGRGRGGGRGKGRGSGRVR